MGDDISINTLSYTTTTDSVEILNTLLQNTTYYWKVEAKDEEGAKISSKIWNFKTNVPPNPFNLLSPTDSSIIKSSGGIELKWEASIDPDENDNITYDVYFDENNPSPTTKIAEGLSDAFIELDTLQQGSTYYWKVKAKDENSGVTISTKTFCFTVNICEMITVEGNDSIPTFKISKYEVTAAQYAEFLNYKRIDYAINRLELKYIESNTTANDHSTHTIYFNRDQEYQAFPVIGRDSCPIMNVTWDGAQAFCEWAGGRLPTDEEWEYAASGGAESKGYIYAGSDTLDKVAWHSGNSGDIFHQVGTKDPNELGIYDMSGNVDEWTSTTNDNGSNYIARGGSCKYTILNCEIKRNENPQNYYNIPYYNNYSILGFRLVIP